MTALHIAVHNGHVEAVEVLTHKMNKEDINARDNVSHTIIIIICSEHICSISLARYTVHTLPVLCEFKINNIILLL